MPADGVAETSSRRHRVELSPRETPRMPTTLVIRPATATDLLAIGDLIADLGYTARREVLHAMLGPMLEDRTYMLFKDEAARTSV